VLSVAVVPVFGGILLSIVGDAARYLHVAPTNIQRRHEIRQAGLKVLAALHARGYDRIIVVGHSLGSVIGYDVLTHAWAATNTLHAPGIAKMAALDQAEQVARACAGADDVESWRQAQAAFGRELKANGNPWRVTDFITLGSPLAHAAVLLADDHPALLAKQQKRELPTCPPTPETFKVKGQPVERFSYVDDPAAPNYRVPHHAAVFAATRWSNLYFPCRFVIKGDVVGGPLAPWFGQGVADIPVSTKLRGGFLSHTLYWTRPDQGAATHVDTLREVLDLVDKHR
jgi:pimeloyl-ACP methyl ester carboxylesterase